MKLLRWMQHKPWQNINPCKDFTIGNSCACLSVWPSSTTQKYYPKPSLGSRDLNQTQNGSQISFSEFDPSSVEEEFQDKSSTVITELFQGFLTIGTLGEEPIFPEPATPTFTKFFKNATMQETEATENDLKLISDHLEKFLEIEAKEGEYMESSRRNSHVSIIALSNKQMEGADTEDYEKTVSCPLQGYLLGSAIEQPDNKQEVKNEKVSLGELFKRSKTVDEHFAVNHEKGNKQGKGTYKFAMHLMNKMLKKLHTSPKSCPTTANSDAAVSVSTKRKLHKVLHMFHRKIHPESTTATKECTDSSTCKIKSTPSNSGYGNKDMMLLDEGQRLCPQTNVLNERFPHNKANLNLAYSVHSSSGISGREHWIKSDAHYLVLEL